MGVVMNLNIAVVILNVIILSGLLWTYAGMLRQASSRFTWGLLLFAGALWLQNVVQLYFFGTMMQYFVAGVQALVLVQNGLATVASLVLLTVTLRPTSSRAMAANN
jgi:hypothetical protein